MFPQITLPGWSLPVCRLLVQAAEAAYRDGAAIDALAKAKGAGEFGFRSAEGTECFFAIRGNDILISFRGTSELNDWKTDAKFRRIPWVGGLVGPTVHRGIHGAYFAVREQLLSALAGKKKTHRIFISGHSLGGALAVLCALDLRENNYPVHAVYTFGQPRVGNAAFSRYYNSILGACTFRMVNEEDIITRLPSWFQGYRHVGQEIFMDSFGAAVVSPSWWRKIPSDIWGFAKGLDVVIPPLTAGNALKDHFVKNYVSRITE